MATNWEKASPAWRRRGGYMFCVAALVFVGICVWDLVLGFQAGNWPEARGMLVSLGEETTRGRRGRRSTRLAIEYAYEVQGRSYTNDRVAYGSWNDKDVPEAWAAKYGDGGTRFPVYYNPGNPAQAVIVRGTPVGPWLMLAIAAVLCGFGIHLVRWANREERDGPDPGAEAPIRRGKRRRARAGAVEDEEPPEDPP